MLLETDGRKKREEPVTFPDRCVLAWIAVVTAWTTVYLVLILRAQSRLADFDNALGRPATDREYLNDPELIGAINAEWSELMITSVPMGFFLTYAIGAMVGVGHLAKLKRSRSRRLLAAMILLFASQVAIGVGFNETISTIIDIVPHN